MSGVGIANRMIFLLSVLVTGSVAGIAVWAILFAMNVGISAIWDRVPIYLGDLYPVLMCLVGGLVIGLFIRRFGQYPEELPTVMAKVKETGRYEYGDVGRMSVGALLPLVFGGSVGPEAGLTGVIAGVCTWAGDRLKRFGSDFKELTQLGMYAAVSAIFTAPLYGFAGAMGGKRVHGEHEILADKVSRAVVTLVAVAGAILTILALTHYVGGGMSMPRFPKIEYGSDELVWLIPLALVGAAAGWLYCVLHHVFARASERAGDRPVSKAVLAGLILGVCGVILPFTMFSGETQSEEIMELWPTMTIAVLLLTGFVKIVVTAMCVNFGWRGGHFFPVIFAGIAIGYGMAAVSGVDPAFCVCACTAATVGGVMRQPLMAVLLLFLCFPVEAVLAMAVAAVIGSYMPLPKFIGATDKTYGGGSD